MKRFLAVLLAAVMTVSLVACGEAQTGTDVEPTTAPTQVAEPTKAPDPTPVPDEISIDFEDGNFGFAMMKTKPRKADESILSVADVNGSKALYVQHVDAAEMHVGIDVDAILGEKVTEVRTISFSIGTEHGDAKFASAAGQVLVYTTEALTETKLGDWSVYMEKKNPKTVSYTLPEGVAFTAGNDNYFVINKLEDTGSVVADFYVDDIRFYDANGNVLKGDTTVAMEAPNGFLKVVEEDDNTTAVKIDLDAAYAGDWGQTATIGADVLSQFPSGVTITVKYELQSGYDYYLWGPMDASWAKLGPAKATVDGGEKYHMQDDGFIVVDDWTNNQITFTLSADVVAELVAGGGLSGQTYGVTVFEAALSGEAAAKITEKVAGEEAYAGDWGQSGIVSAEALAKIPGDVTVTVKFELQSGYDYYLWGPMDASWAKLGPAKTGLTAKGAAEEGDKYHIQDDGFIVIDDLTNGELTFTIPAATAAELVAGGGLSGQTYGVTVYEIVLSGMAPSTIKEKVEGDAAYAGDWGQSGIVSADVLSKFPGDVTVTVKFELQSGYDYYLYGPMDASWAKLGPAKTGLTAKGAAEEGDKYHIQDDGFIVIDDLTNGELTYNLSAATVAELVASGGLSAQTYGVVAYEIVLEGAAPKTIKEKVACEEAYAGDWGQSGIVSADALAKFGDVTVTVKFELQSGYDYYLWGPMDASWAKLGPAKTGLTAKGAAEEGDKYHIQDDGFIVIDDLTNGELTFTLSADTVAELVAGGGFSGQTYGVTVYEIVLEGTEAAAAPAGDATVEEPAVDDIMAEYAGDYGLGWGATVAELQELTGNVTITFDVAYTGTVDYPQFTFIDQGDSWSKLKAEDFTGNVPTINSYEFIEMFDPSVTSYSATITADALARIIANGGGLGIQVNGIVIRNATLVDESGSGDDIMAEYAGDYGLGWGATVEELKAFTGNVTITFDVAYTNSVDYPQFTFIDQGDSWSKLKAADFTGNVPKINSYEFIEMFDPSVTSYSATITADALARIIANGGGLGIQVNGIVVRNATLTAAE